MDEVLEFLKKTGTYYIATEQGDQPEVRPFGTILRFEDKLYIQTGKVKDVYKQIMANPKVGICAFDGKGTWLRITATLVEDDRLEPQEAMMADYPGLAGRYQPGDGNNVVFYMKDAKATFSSFTAESYDVEI